MNPISFRGASPITYLSGTKKEVNKIAKEMHLVPVITGKVDNEVLAVGLPKKIFKAFKEMFKNAQHTPDETKVGFNNKVLAYLGITPGYGMPVITSKHK
jgi:hypothetical protein